MKDYLNYHGLTVDVCKERSWCEVVVAEEEEKAASEAKPLKAFKEYWG